MKYLPPGHHVANEFAAGDAHTVVLLPGVHQVEENRISLESNKTLYLSGGAHLRAYVIGDEVHNAAIRGPGVIDGTGLPCRSREWRDDGDAAFVFFRRGSRNTIDGPIIYDSPFWNIVTFGSRQMRIRNHKAVTWKMNNDGVQPRSCNDLLVEHCFLKCADDCIAIKTRRAAGMQSRNLIFRNLVLFNDKPGNPMEIGHTSQADLLGDVVFEHIDVVFAHGGHTISVTLIDHCTVRDIVYRGIRVEGHRTHEIKLVITTSKYTTDDQRGQIRNVMIDDILLTGSPLGGLIAGFDEAHMIRDVTIRNMRFLETAGGHPRVVESIEAIGIEMRLAERVVVIAGN